MEGEDRQQQGEQQQNFMLQEVAQTRPLPNQQCPRCQSMDTKFGYFNNNNIGQPRYLCKACKRYWTQGGKMRNIPPGGGVKKARRGELFRFDIPSPLPSVGLGAGGVHNLHLPSAGFGLATQNFSRPQQITITRGNTLSLLKGFKNGFNPVMFNPVGQGQDQNQGRDQNQSQSHPGGQGQGQVPNPVQGFADHPNGATDLWMQPPSAASATAAATNYPPFEADADVYWENIYNGGGNSGGSSSTDWSGPFSDFGPDF